MNGNEGENRPELADYSYYFYGDGLGSVRVVEDFLGRIYSAFLYDAYGVRRCSRANGDGGCEIYPSFGFAGQFTDGASGLQYLRARYYDPQTQQFLTKDPLERITGQPYVYAYGNPVNYTDPTGMSGGGSNQQLPPEPIRGGQLPTVGAGRALESGMEGGLLIDYGRIDRSGRPTGIEAIITREMLGTGSEADSSIVPPGFKGREEGHARGHLLGKQLGGSGSVRRNLVTLFQRPVNTPIMSKFEGQVAAAVRSGETVWYRATPIYRGAEGMPYAITLEAQGSGGFSLGVSIFNRVLRP
jgi:RHS repeat-associated protein